MPKHKSIFAEEWRECLLEHYRYVVTIGDTITETTLREVLLSIGLSGAEIETLPIAPPEDQTNHQNQMPLF